MKNLLLLLAHLLAAVSRHFGPGGANAVIAENLLPKTTTPRYQPVRGRVESWRGYPLGQPLSVSGVSPFVPG